MNVKYMVDRFLSWKLPRDTFNPDCGITFDKASKCEPTGTDLFDAQQAIAMVQYMIEGMPRPAVEGEAKQKINEERWKDVVPLDDSSEFFEQLEDHEFKRVPGPRPALSPSGPPATGAGVEGAAKAAFVQAQNEYRSEKLRPLLYTWETTTESVRECWRGIARAALSAPLPLITEDDGSGDPIYPQPAADSPLRLRSMHSAPRDGTRFLAKCHVHQYVRERQGSMGEWKVVGTQVAEVWFNRLAWDRPQFTFWCGTEFTQTTDRCDPIGWIPMPGELS